MLIFNDSRQITDLNELHKEEEERLIQTLADSYGLPYIDLKSLAPEPDAMRMVSKKDAEESQLVPFKIVGHKLYIRVSLPKTLKLPRL